MILTLDNIMIFGSILLILSMFVSKTSSRFGIPILFLFLVIGVIAGTDSLIGIRFSNVEDARFIGILSLIIILYSGGLSTDIDTIKPILKQGVTLSIFGVLITAVLAAVFCHLVIGLPLLESLLIASIVSSTDAAAVFNIFNSSNINVNANLRSLLELESGSNDPTAFLLTITFIELISHPYVSVGNAVFSFLTDFVLGIVFGVVIGWLSIKVINKIRLHIDGLYLVLTLGIAVFTYAISDALHGNGCLSVYIAGLILGNSDFVHKRSIKKFFDGFVWLMQAIMFVMLGMFVNINSLIPLLGTGLLISLFLMFAARPVAVALCLAPFRTPIRQQGVISWMGLRGAVPLILAMYPLAANIGYAESIFNIVFIIASTSLLLQGMTIPSVAKWLGVTEEGNSKLNTVDIDKYADSMGEIAEIDIIEETEHTGKTIMELELPKQALIVMLQRDKINITPNGSTQILVGDKMLIVAETKQAIQELKEKIGIKSETRTVINKIKKENKSVTIRKIRKNRNG